MRFSTILSFLRRSPGHAQRVYGVEEKGSAKLEVERRERGVEEQRGFSLLTTPSSVRDLAGERFYRYTQALSVEPLFYYSPCKDCACVQRGRERNKVSQRPNGH